MSNQHHPDRPSFHSLEADQILENAAKSARNRSTVNPIPPPEIPIFRGISAEAEAKILASRQAEAVEAERRKAEQRAAELRKACGVPARYADASLDDLSALPADAARPYQATAEALKRLAKTPAIVVLSGSRGPGKTHMACAIVNQRCRAGVSAFYSPTMHFFTELKCQFKPGGDEKIVNRIYKLPSLLVLDEVQDRSESEWENRMLTRLIDDRYADLQTTILITNQKRDEFLSGVGKSIQSRIEDGGAIIECTWPSLRGRIKGKSQ